MGIITEPPSGVCRSLMPIKEEQVDIENAVAWIPDFKYAWWDWRSAADG